MELHGSFRATGCRFAIIVSRFNAEITDGLLAGARAVLADAAVSPADITVVRVPGAFEIPLAAQTLARTGRFDAVIALGCLIKGDTMHFEYIAEAASHGIMHASLSTGIPIAFGVLTTLDEAQARARAGAGDGNKGREAAQAAVDMVTLFQQIRQEPR